MSNDINDEVYSMRSCDGHMMELMGHVMVT